MSGRLDGKVAGRGLLAGESPHLYSATTAALIHLTRSVALELGEHGIRVNAICPGVIVTPLAVGRRRIEEGRSDRFREKVGRSSRSVASERPPTSRRRLCGWLRTSRAS